jgi:hypothetical protein
MLVLNPLKKCKQITPNEYWLKTFSHSNGTKTGDGGWDLPLTARDDALFLGLTTRTYGHKVIPPLRSVLRRD